MIFWISGSEHFLDQEHGQGLHCPDGTVDMGNYTKLSKAVSRALRHQPWVYELEIDAEGWTRVDDLLTALRRESAEWVSLELKDLELMIAESSKPRHEIRGPMIRALHGHSFPGRIHIEPSDPPPTLFHGTSFSKVESIRTVGLLPMGRQYVHLSTDAATAVVIGNRKKGETVVLRIDSASASKAGVVFRRSNDLVWLADRIPAKFIHFPDTPQLGALDEAPTE